MTAVKEPAYRKRVAYQAGVLGGFATMAAVLLLSGNILTKDVIKARRQEDLRQSLDQVIPASLYEGDLLDNNLTLPENDADTHVTIYRGIRKNQVNALAYEVVGHGYAGPIRILLGLDIHGTLLGVRVLSHAETPGLGDKIEVERDDWILGFTGLSLGNPPVDRWRVKKDGGDFDQFSGATITPRAVVGAIVHGLTFFREHRGRITALETKISTQHAGDTR